MTGNTNPEKKIDQELAEIAYEAYGATTEFKNFRGDPMPKWNELPETIQTAWRAAANAVGEAVKLR